MFQELGEESSKVTGGRRHFRDWCLFVFCAMLVASTIALRVSVMTASVRLLMVGTIVSGVVAGLLYLIAYFTVQPKAFFPALFFALLLLTWAVLGNKPPNSHMLRDAYQRRLSSFEGTPYVWGGETKSGVDCSGLARAAMWEAMLKQGITQANPRLLGPVFWKFWWRDLSARDMGNGKYGYTHYIGCTKKLAGYDTSKLQVGDLAVIQGVHVLVYYGEGRWIEASPGDRKVVVNRAPANSRRGWFNTPATLVRWWILDSPRKH